MSIANLSPLSQLALVQQLVTRSNSNRSVVSQPSIHPSELVTTPSREVVLIPGESAFELAKRLGLYDGPEPEFINWLRASVAIENLISKEQQNELRLGSDRKLYAEAPSSKPNTGSR